jgi:hypothetical protein
MPILSTKKALERRLMTLTPSVPTAFEGVSFTPPATIYQRCQFRLDGTDDPTLGAGAGIGYHRERIQMQVFIVAEANKGTAAAITRAQLIRDLFKKGTTLLEGVYRIHITSTPTMGSASPIGTRTIVPVFVNVWTEVYE